ncbi:uncharacterized protein Z520_08059 [Fonsecaea multimorphosa CBS 102226]|uniref:DNA repair protein Rad26 n=1 Tax=Fonsecaea multimorphosa CBS 102226 TaxID=1442371 RepID=A0A0D2IGU7_9EURO|nr:uncharacterized protein Z520_08059 [Fonsecaea multimorphosa CBS 102226]KIX96281.1 hypothetical protein Z520_08059 [Fonsecaea multimorphosa CBS 102226]OAL21943.1 hypothetical protein AYO22_07540 [Fonsecaea multimorphosa]
MSGMDDNEDETDLFDDDDFDNLSESALQQLEHHAILSTQKAQASKTAPVPAHPSTTLPQSKFVPQAPFNARPQPAHPAIQRYLTEDDDSFELVGEEGVPTPIDDQDSYPIRRIRLGEAVQREQFRQQRYGQAYGAVSHPPLEGSNHRRQRGSFEATPAGGFNHGPAAGLDEMSLDTPLQQTGTAVLEDAHDASHKGLDELLREREELARELRAAREMVSMQKGEISIIRANFEKESKVYDRQIGALKKSMEEESAKHNAALNALSEKNHSLTTRYQFLQQEHNQGLQETKSLRQRLKDRQTEKESDLTTTPKRGVASSLRDGFNDDDIMLMSPSKSARRSKPSTPTAAGKRKRKTDGPSPVKPLVLRPTSSTSQDEMPPPPQPIQTIEQVISVVRKDKQAERNLKFLQSVMEYRIKDSKQPLFEALTKFAFPSNPSKTFSALLWESIAQLKGSRLPGDLLQLLIDLWCKSLKEQYYKPIASLREIANHIIDHDMLVLDSGIINAIIPLLKSTITINAEKRFEHSPVNHATYGKVRQTPQSVINLEVDGTSCLELMLTVAYTVSDDLELISLLWRLMDHQFILMMLNAWQPISDITLMLRLLATSIFPATFGSICVDDQQSQVEHWMMNRICSLLRETPNVDEGVAPYTDQQLCQLRLEAMDLLIKIAITSSPPPHDNPSHHGSLLIANDTHAIARLIRSLYDQVSAMYSLHPTTHTLHASLVNKGVCLLHHLLQLHGSTINLQEKLSVINGGVHKHRVVLTRLAFSEGFVVDKYVSDETVAMATQMLEESVTPDEADELVKCFPGFNGRGGAGRDEEE